MNDKENAFKIACGFIITILLGIAAIAFIHKADPPAYSTQPAIAVCRCSCACGKAVRMQARSR